MSTDPLCSSDTFAVRKARQAAKIREITDALVSSGHYTLDEQAKALGIGRSTAWAILKNGYKNTGMSAAVAERVLSSAQLPPPVRAKVNEYVAEKIQGLYGHGLEQRRRFCAHLCARLVEHGNVEELALDRRLAGR
jgi:DNA-binding CsgD family transcriptional regulator